MEDKDNAISKLAEMVISWQKMYNTNLKQMEKIDGKKRLRVIISEKQDIINEALESSFKEEPKPITKNDIMGWWHRLDKETRDKHIENHGFSFNDSFITTVYMDNH